MTMLNWWLTENIVEVYSDTLALSGNSDRRPRNFVSKTFPVQRLNLLIAGGGSHNLIVRWMVHVCANSLSADIHELDAEAPEVLRTIYPEECGDIPMSTIYSFGWSPAENRCVGFAYRSTNNFASERLEYAMAYKPPPNDQDVWLDSLEDVPSMIEMALLQQAQDRERALADRWGIGGDIIMYALGRNDDGAVATWSTIVRPFEHRDQDAADCAETGLGETTLQRERALYAWRRQAAYRIGEVFFRGAAAGLDRETLAGLIADFAMGEATNGPEPR